MKKMRKAHTKPKSKGEERGKTFLSLTVLCFFRKSTNFSLHDLIFFAHFIHRREERCVFEALGMNEFHSCFFAGKGGTQGGR
jgi:hypothetical protein